MLHCDFGPICQWGRMCISTTALHPQQMKWGQNCYRGGWVLPWAGEEGGVAPDVGRQQLCCCCSHLTALHNFGQKKSSSTAGTFFSLVNQRLNFTYFVLFKLLAGHWGDVQRQLFISVVCRNGKNGQGAGTCDPASSLPLTMSSRNLAFTHVCIQSKNPTHPQQLRQK